MSSLERGSIATGVVSINEEVEEIMVNPTLTPASDPIEKSTPMVEEVDTSPGIEAIESINQEEDEIMVNLTPASNASEHTTPMVEEVDTSPELKAMVSNKSVQSKNSNAHSNMNMYAVLVAIVGLAAATIILSSSSRGSACSPPADAALSSYVSFVPDNSPADIETIFTKGENVCKDKNPKWANVDCIHPDTGPQAGANVTKGFVGEMEVDVVPNDKMYWQSSMCPVNVHWHLGTEHYSVGEYDEFGNGPNGNAEAPTRRLAAKGEDVRGGFRCHHYDEKDPKYTTKYEWKHCVGMEVGETYEVHWPHSAAGACGTVNQYQTPFYDGVFCNLNADILATLSAQDVANSVGVQAQIFTVVNDEEYFYPDMIRSWIVDGEYGKDIAYYTGSTTGTSRDNEICSAYR
jgi:hypothetical protein